MRSLPLEARLSAYTFHVVHEEIKTTLPIQFDSIASADRGSLMVTFAAELAFLTSYLLRHGITGLYRDPEKRNLAEDRKIKDLAIARAEQEKQHNALKSIEQRILLLFDSVNAGLILNQSMGAAQKCRKFKPTWFEEGFLPKVELSQKSIKASDTKAKKGSAGEFAIFKDYNREYQAAHARCSFVTKKRLELQHTLEMLQKTQPALTVKIQKFPGFFGLLDFGAADPILDGGVADRVRRYDPKWWGAFVAGVENRISKDLESLSYKVMLRDPVLNFAFENELKKPNKGGFTEQGHWSNICANPKQYDPDFFLPGGKWLPEAFGTHRSEVRKADGECRAWINLHGGPNHPYDPFLLGRPRTAVIDEAGSTKDKYLHDLMILLERRHA